MTSYMTSARSGPSSTLCFPSFSITTFLQFAIPWVDMASAPGPADQPSDGSIDLSFLCLSSIDRDPRLTQTRTASLERTIRELIAAKDYAKIEAILDQLCNDYAYAVHQPHARNGGLIGLAAAAIALGPVG